MTKKHISIVNKVKKNPWIFSTFVLAALVVVMMITGFAPISGNASANTVGENFVEFINSRGGAQIELVSAKSFSKDLYEVVVLADGGEVPAHITKDGKYFVQLVAPITEEVTEQQAPANTASEVVKSDKPVVELFIWSYCPYGVMAQGPLAEVVSLLGDSADFKAIMYYDGHGAYETQQNKIQACIQENEPDKYWEYAGEFVEKIYPKCGSTRDIECDKSESIALMDSIGIDSESIMSCVDSNGADLIARDSNYAKSLGVTGSPTIIVNGAKVNVARNAEAIKGAVCTAFNSAPESCAEVLASETPSSTTTASC